MTDNKTNIDKIVKPRKFPKKKGKIKDITISKSEKKPKTSE